MTTTTEDDDQKAKQTALDVRNIMLPSTSDVLYGLVDGSIVSTTWNQLTGSTDRLASYVLKKVGDNVGGVAGNIIDYFASGATMSAMSTASRSPIPLRSSTGHRGRRGHWQIRRRQKSQRDGPAFPGGGG